jgi:hypothetical protein
MVNKGNGGYALIDLSGTDLSAGSKVTISGLYNKLETAYKSNRPIIGCNLVDGGKGITPSQLSILKNGTDYEATIGVNKITVDKNDGVVVSSLVTGGTKTTVKKA